MLFRYFKTRPWSAPCLVRFILKKVQNISTSYWLKLKKHQRTPAFTMAMTPNKWVSETHEIKTVKSCICCIFITRNKPTVCVWNTSHLNVCVKWLIHTRTQYLNHYDIIIFTRAYWWCNKAKQYAVKLKTERILR